MMVQQPLRPGGLAFLAAAFFFEGPAFPAFAFFVFLAFALVAFAFFMAPSISDGAIELPARSNCNAWEMKAFTIDRFVAFSPLRLLPWQFLA
jgi:hypothetical protein